MNRKTKIVCTLGPAVNSPEMIRRLLETGMNVARFNFSHGDHESHRKTFELFDSIRRELKNPAAAMLDTKGPEIRTGLMKDGKIFLEAGSPLVLTGEEAEGTPERISITHKTLYRDVRPGGTILIDDGLIELTVEEIAGTEIHCRVMNSGFVSNRKGINVPGADLSMPYLSEKDIADIHFGIEMGFDFIAASFVSSADDLLEVRRLLDSKNCHSIRIIAKIESAKALENIDDIIRLSDGIMVARGDLGVEIPYSEVPVAQKTLIRKAISRGKIVITATQMLESMTEKPRPTRAEATDVANAIYDGSSAVMLSGETAAGKYPIEAVRTMATIAQRAEGDIDYRKRLQNREPVSGGDLTYAVAHATCTMAHDLGAAAIIPVTCSGYTARMTSGFRPAVPIIACTPYESTYHHLSLSWGVTPVLMRECQNGSEEMLEQAIEAARTQGLLADGDMVVLTAGMPIGVPGTTNLIKVDVVGDVLATGHGIGGKSATARVCVAHDEEEAASRFRAGDILVVPQTTNGMMSFLRSASGIIIEEGGEESHGAVVGMTLDIPVLIGAQNATNLLKNGVSVTLDAATGRVYRAPRQTALNAGAAGAQR
ncbi:pyruvate kinase [Yanshouia hominis]|uniref:Pyruvate kinase n=1 Tax=Yanshouia hominis TaxID=2763673 RepID=A0ABR7NEJ2_9FIRM|nr:pyruvate kinase [Yanshouia hominis]MBC8574823.1 pyruvate kinase [Yanshouia hominis]